MNYLKRTQIEIFVRFERVVKENKNRNFYDYDLKTIKIVPLQSPFRHMLTFFVWKDFLEGEFFVILEHYSIHGVKLILQ